MPSKPAPLQLLVVTKGHAYDRTAFTAMLEADRGIAATSVDQPAARVLLRPEHVDAYDAVLFYDMSGIPIPGAPFAGDPPGQPPADYCASIEALLDSGKGLVLLNHALISWPAWPVWREISQTSFMLSAGELEGSQTPGSGFRGGAGEPARNAKMHVTPATAGHPVLDGLDTGFDITDELYLKTAGFESRVVPLLRSDFPFTQPRFTPPPLAQQAEREAWQHPDGSDLVVWANAARRSPVVASELGDGPDAYANEGFRRLLGNAVRWVASPEARSWAAARNA